MDTSSVHVVLFVYAVASLLHWQASAVLTAGDPNDAKFIATLSDFSYFVSLGQRGVCAGTIIGRRHVVTAAHCLCGFFPFSSIKTILSDDSIVYPQRAYFNPGCSFDCDDDGPNRCDVAILEYDSEIALASVPIPVYQWSDEVGRTISILGYGVIGDARTGVCNDPDGKFRRAENVVMDVDGSPGGVMRYALDRQGLSSEGLAQDGDSGGPAIIIRNGVSYVAGANSGTSESNSCDYGSVDQYSRLSAHYSFISDILNQTDDTVQPQSLGEGRTSDLQASRTTSTVLVILGLCCCWCIVTLCIYFCCCKGGKRSSQLDDDDDEDDEEEEEEDDDP